MVDDGGGDMRGDGDGYLCVAREEEGHSFSSPLLHFTCEQLVGSVFIYNPLPMGCIL